MSRPPSSASAQASTSTSTSSRAPTTTHLGPDVLSHVSSLDRLLTLLDTFHLESLDAFPPSTGATGSVARAANQPTLTAIEEGLHADLDRARSHLEQIQLAREDQETEAARSEVDDVVRWASSELARLRNTSRTALIGARKRLTQARHLADRAALLGGGGANASSPSAADKSRSPDDPLSTASADLTASLQRTLTLLSSTLTQSTYSAQLLEESSNSLKTLSGHYTSFTLLLANSSAQIKQMEAAERWELLLLLGSFLFFWACVLYILKRRIWDKGVGMVLGGVWRLGKGGVGGAIKAGGKVGQIAKGSANEAKEVLDAAATTTMALGGKAAVKEAITSMATAAAAAAAAASTGASSALKVAAPLEEEGVAVPPAAIVHEEL